MRLHLSTPKQREIVALGLIRRGFSCDPLRRCCQGFAESGRISFLISYRALVANTTTPISSNGEEFAEDTKDPIGSKCCVACFSLAIRPGIRALRVMTKHVRLFGASARMRWALCIPPSAKGVH